ncbi:dTMP kinase [Dolosicoccus paucivorans]|uniref:Thymidylate kinase n=1 Tax=Dolosicoccus paucivorans TaxID=84521 RepID=A0A1G8KUQ8_9LACT|nr:dTMP kinase [Dolosicoccus paucivorans]PMB83976.1 dTMP kinase [Dolosicoccus paucivorans]PMC58256.1 dTMP kinase [Dolosicoccus paucivorans]SDI47178.1 thymidylate kinase [Dolosicoccus paucivorans]
MSGKFITFEGPDGSGKTSVIARIIELLNDQGITEIVSTREPGGSAIAERIREVILDVNHTEMDSRTEALLYAAARRQHLVERILPSLQEGKLVLCDRFVDSSLAYQGIARGIDIEKIWQINQFAIEGYMPVLTFLLDVPAEVGLERIYKARGERQYDRLDQESLSFHQKTRQAFLDFAEQSDRIVVVDATQSIDDVAKACLVILKERQII